MITTLFSPAEIAMTGNPIAYSLQTNNANCAFFGLKLYVETTFQSGVYEKIVELASPPDLNRQTVFYLEYVLESSLEDFVPNFSLATLQKATKLVKRYYVELAELSATDSMETATFTAQPTRYAMKAKHHRQAYPTRASELPNGNFLYQRARRYLSLVQKDWLSIIPTADIADLSLGITLNYTDSTTATYNSTFGAARKYEPVFLPLGFAERAYNSVNPAKTISWISIALPYGGTLTLIPIDTASARMATEVHYYNNLGGLESYIFSGQLKEDKESSFTQFQHYQAYNYSQLDQEFKNYEKTVRKSGQLFSGFMPYPEDTYLLDAIESEIFYIRQPNGDFYPANNVTSKQEAINTYQRIMSLKLEFNYAFNE